MAFLLWCANSKNWVVVLLIAAAAVLFGKGFAVATQRVFAGIVGQRYNKPQQSLPLVAGTAKTLRFFVCPCAGRYASLRKNMSNMQWRKIYVMVNALIEKVEENEVALEVKAEVGRLGELIVLDELVSVHRIVKEAPEVDFDWKNSENQEVYELILSECARLAKVSEKYI